MNVKNIITKVCNGQYENVDKLLKNEIAKIQEMRLLQSGIKHNGKHPDIYVIKVNTDIVNADMIGGEAAVRLRLEQIRNILSNAQKSDNWKTVL